jgi:molybdate/tungstate transport system substrate-binding protein
VGHDSSDATRRRFLRTAGTAVVAGAAGCTGGGGGRGGAAGATATRTVTGTSGRGEGRPATIAVLAAGSLQHALEDGFEPAVDVPVRVETHGSATVARMVAEGQRDPDIVTVADVALFEGPLSPPWYSTFASNAVVVAYNPDTDGGRRVADAGEAGWYEPMVDGSVRVGRTDPDLDPLGYRTLFTLELASRYYEDAPDLRERVPRRDQIYPETSLISQFETGSIDAAFAYRNMAVERGYDYVPLPNPIDLSDPNYADDWYATVSYTLSSGRTIRGGVVGYGSTIRRLSDAAVTVFDVHTTGDYLDESGFVRRDGFPTYEGDPPRRVREATARPGAGRSTEHPRVRPPTGSGTVSEITVLV